MDILFLIHKVLFFTWILESVQKRAARFVTGNYKYGWHFGTVKKGIPQENEERQ